MGRISSELGFTFERIIYIGVKYDNIQINEYMILYEEEVITCLTEYYTTLNNNSFKNREYENNEFEDKFPKIMKHFKGNLNISVFGAGRIIKRDIIYDYFKNQFNFDDKKRLNINLLNSKKD